MLMPGRSYSASGAYRYGFNGKENDNEVKGEGNQQDYGMRIYDPRLGRFLSVDPLTGSFPMLTPYQFASNRSIQGIDLDGLEFFDATNCYVNLFVKYDPVLKCITRMRVAFDMDHKNRPHLLDESLLNHRGVASNTTGGPDATVGRYDLPISEPPSAKDLEMQDTNNEKDLRTTGYKLPNNPKNNKERRSQLKNKEFYTTTGVNNRRLDAISATITIVSTILEIRASFQWDSYMKKVKWQTELSGNVVNILQYGISSGIITEAYLNDASLTDLANYFMKGGEITSFVFNEESNKWEIKTDQELTKIAQKLWSDYQTAIKEIEKKKSESDAEKRNRSSVDNTQVSSNP